jgi:hypothetical protein
VTRLTTFIAPALATLRRRAERTLIDGIERAAIAVDRHVVARFHQDGDPVVGNDVIGREPYNVNTFIIIEIPGRQRMMCDAREAAVFAMRLLVAVAVDARLRRDANGGAA